AARRAQIDHRGPAGEGADPRADRKHGRALSGPRRGNAGGRGSHPVPRKRAVRSRPQPRGRSRRSLRRHRARDPRRPGALRHRGKDPRRPRASFPLLTARYCLVCGTRLRAVREHGRPRRRCPRCGWTFYDNPVPAAVALVERGDRVLLVRRARPPYAGTWDLPGGFLEAGETPERGLRRELREELGLRVGRLRLMGFATDRYGPRGFPVLTVIYAVTAGPGRLRIADDVS